MIILKSFSNLAFLQYKKSADSSCFRFILVVQARMGKISGKKFTPGRFRMKNKVQSAAALAFLGLQRIQQFFLYFSFYAPQLERNQGARRPVF